MTLYSTTVIGRLRRKKTLHTIIGPNAPAAYWPKKTSAYSICEDLKKFHTRVMTVIPRCAVEIGDKRVCKSASWRNWALSNTRYAIHPTKYFLVPKLQNHDARYSRGSFLKNTVPVKAGTLLRGIDSIVNRHLNCVAP